MTYLPVTYLSWYIEAEDYQQALADFPVLASQLLLRGAGRVPPVMVVRCLAQGRCVGR